MCKKILQLTKDKQILIINNRDNTLNRICDNLHMSILYKIKR